MTLLAGMGGVVVADVGAGGGGDRDADGESEESGDRKG